MKLRHAAGLVTALVLSIAQPVHSEGPSSANRDAAALAKLDDTWNEALKRHDANAISEIVADDYVATDADGNLTNKADAVEAARNAADSYRIIDRTIQVSGDVGIVRAKFEMSSNDHVFYSVRFTYVCQKRKGRWVAIGGQDTHVPP